MTEEERREAEIRCEKLIRKVRGYNSAADTDLIRKAFYTALELHKMNFRKGGAPHITHALGAAEICADFQNESRIIAAALLHDCVEDENITNEEIREEFGSEVAELVEAVTNLDASLKEELGVSKEELDILSDVKLIEHISANPQALYIKVADRIHNLSDMKDMPYYKAVAKTVHTEEILIPLLRTIHAAYMIEILQDLCFKVKNIKAFRIVEECYKKMCGRDANIIEWMKDYLESVLKDDRTRYYIPPGNTSVLTDELSAYGKSCRITFCERYCSSIFRDVQEGVNNIFADLKGTLVKKNVPLLDIYFVAGRDCPLSPTDLFFGLYSHIHDGVYIPREEKYSEVRFMLTFTGTGRDKVTGLPFLLMRDTFGIGYRLFPETADQHQDHIKGDIFRYNNRRMPRLRVIDRTAPSTAFGESIYVFLRNGKVREMPAGSTVLDLALKIHPYVGLCAKYALLNGMPGHIPLYTKLTDGDQVEIITDADPDKNHPERNIVHADIRWIEYARTREGRKELIRFFEKHRELIGPGRVTGA